MRYLLTGLAIVLMASGVASAQTATPTSRLAWDQVAPSQAAAQGYVYEGAFDGGAPQSLTATCTGTASPFACVASFPALTPGPHSVRLRAVDTTTVPGTRLESSLSAAFAFTLVALPDAPSNLRITPGEPQ